MTKIIYPSWLLFVVGVFIVLAVGTSVVAFINHFFVGGMFTLAFCAAVICGMKYLKNHLFVITDSISATKTPKDNWLKFTEEGKDFITVKDNTIKIIMYKK